MPSRSRKSDHCNRCRLFRPLCVCGIIAEMRPALASIQTRVVILMHVRELTLPTNTARLAENALPDCELRLRGGRDQPMPTEGLIVPERESVLLFPSDDAEVLTPEHAQGPRPLTLIVPDGSWRQGRKVASREPAVKGLRRVKLPPGPPSRYLLRKEPNEQSVSTFEAIARALGVLGGPRDGPLVQAKLEELFDLRIERTLWSRGLVKAEDCRFPIPPEAFEAFRRAGMRGGENSQRLLRERALASVGSLTDSQGDSAGTSARDSDPE